MSEALRELYQETILGHNKAPRNFRALDDADHQAMGHNPLCGDKLTVFVRDRDGKIAEATFVGEGCAISRASASMMTEAVQGRSRVEAVRLAQHFRRLVTREGGAADPALLGKLRVFEGVHEFPARVKCASLPWRTFEAALQDRSEGPVRTE